MHNYICACSRARVEHSRKRFRPAALRCIQKTFVYVTGASGPRNICGKNIALQYFVDPPLLEYITVGDLFYHPATRWRRMEEARYSVYLLLLIMICPAATKTEDCPDHIGYDYLYEYPYFTQPYYNLYLKFEEALIKDHSALEQLRAGFVSTETIPVIFDVNLEAVNVANIVCGTYNDAPALCSFSDLEWHLCSPWPLRFSFSSQTAQSEWRMKEVDKSITMLSLIHGNMPSIYLPYYNVFTNVINYEIADSEFTLNLKMNNLTCNPSYQLTKCVLSELLSWVSH